MSKRAFWPGFNWRVLAHKRGDKSPRKDGGFSTESWATYSGEWWLGGGPDRDPFLDGDWEFDELVIDDWLHLEMMNERVWWLGLGNGADYWHLHVSVDGKGKATVSMEKQ